MKIILLIPSDQAEDIAFQLIQGTASDSNAVNDILSKIVIQAAFKAEDSGKRDCPHCARFFNQSRATFGRTPRRALAVRRDTGR